MAKILFLHPNFPAQYKDPCNSLAKENIHDIIFLCQTHYGRKIAGINKLVLKGRGSHERTLQVSKSEHKRSLYRAEAYREAFASLKNRGWSPDVVISHCGWGCGIYLKDIWPYCRFIAYVEWWFNHEGELTKRLLKNPYFGLSEGKTQELSLRNLSSCYEMNIADDVVSPTAWQRQQLPKLLREKCIVIYDHIDRTIFFPDPHKQSSTPLLTYGTRGMEPMRGFPEFINSLPRLLKKWPQLRVEIAGTDSVNYGGLKPPEGSWKKWAQALLLKHNLSDRVCWKDYLSLVDYVDWLKRSWCHIYLSEPFVTSWSFIEACHCAIPMVATRSQAIDEFCHLNPYLIQVDHTSEDEFVAAINDRIRFSSNSSRKDNVFSKTAQAEQGALPELTLAKFIVNTN
jgi:glycosyltransferase involved in cell wall biosynthesis